MLIIYVAHLFQILGISALSVSLLGALVLVGGVGGWSVLTPEGVPIIFTQQEWVWAVAPSPTSNTMVILV